MTKPIELKEGDMVKFVRVTWEATVDPPIGCIGIVYKIYPSGAIEVDFEKGGRTTYGVERNELRKLPDRGRGE